VVVSAGGMHSTFAPDSSEVGFFFFFFGLFVSFVQNLP